jgi:hypothetical protein
VLCTTGIFAFDGECPEKCPSGNELLPPPGADAGAMSVATDEAQLPGDAACAPFTPATDVFQIRFYWDHSGFSTWLIQALNGLHHCEANGLVPYILWGEYDGTMDRSSTNEEAKTNLFYDRELGGNVWEYFFEPVVQGGAGSGLPAWCPSCPGNLHDMGMGEFEELCRWIDPYYTDAGHNASLYEGEWYRETRLRAAALMGKYVRLKPAITAKVLRR